MTNATQISFIVSLNAFKQIPTSLLSYTQSNKHLTECICNRYGQCNMVCKESTIYSHHKIGPRIFPLDENRFS